ncbi:Uncharacterised protein [Actinomyces naeslundii]|uniref:hypothetical protein n=1 Tax=Actinomyces naeslundii TaxID=1655 RepID=UPI00195A01E2|nr:hypothetical protein [Actinomyces naeslundii]VTX93742.1 Uncharacterised protein [Actinomyces naeslundii]
MSESDPTPPTPTPSSAPAAGSSSPGATSSVRASQKATKRRRSTIGGSMKLALVVVLWLQLVSFIGGNIYFNRTM